MIPDADSAGSQERPLDQTKYRTRYTLRAGPPNPSVPLADDEGLTDRLVVASVMGTPGAGALSVSLLALDPIPGDVPPDLAFHVAVALLLRASEGGTRASYAAASALALIRGYAPGRSST